MERIELKNIVAEVEADNGVLILETETTATFKQGLTGYVDDGVNFRLTFENGIITKVENTVAGGHS